MGPCSAWAGHLSCECFLTPNVQEGLWRDVEEILCLHFLFLFLLTPLMQAHVLPARAASGFLVLGQVWCFMLYKRWERLVFDHQCRPGRCPMRLAWPGTGVAVLVKHSGFLQADPSFPGAGVALALLNVLPLRCWESRVGLDAG